jgi:hypothetical protein
LLLGSREKILTIKILPAKLVLLIVINNDLILKNNVCNFHKTETQKLIPKKSDEIPELKWKIRPRPKRLKMVG